MIDDADIPPEWREQLQVLWLQRADSRRYGTRRRTDVDYVAVAVGSMPELMHCQCGCGFTMARLSMVKRGRCRYIPGHLNKRVRQHQRRRLQFQHD